MLAVHVTTDLEDVLRKRIEELRERLRHSSIDRNARRSDLLHAQLATLQWVITEAGLEP